MHYACAYTRVIYTQHKQRVTGVYELIIVAVYAFTVGLGKIVSVSNLSIAV